jgi:hypothetical protein
MDLALSVTYFPHCGMTYAILFGCPLTTEQEIIKRLSFASMEAQHPLLVPGIFAELERSRHVGLVEKTIDELELKIVEIDNQSSLAGEMDRSEVERRNQEKRSAWLDTTYLRNNLVSWSTQLRKMAAHEKELKWGFFRSRTRSAAVMNRMRRNLNSESFTVPRIERDDLLLLLDSDDIDFLDSGDSGAYDDRTLIGADELDLDAESARLRMRRAGRKIQDRLAAIIDEYDDKIRDCSMRVDGMAMATQWVRSCSTKSQSGRNRCTDMRLRLPGKLMWRSL